MAQPQHAEVTPAEIRSAISAIDTLIQWSINDTYHQQQYKNGTQTSFEALAILNAAEACQFLKDHLL